ncbi:MAG: MBL fold metallo-hydrolase [Candidatus Acidiferrales bacterium]|jgi:phosphoribosyl 1,2-cyclic phosphodiesterase
MAKPSRKVAQDRLARLRFWGVRGSTPTVDKATWRYGGNTACVELTTPAGARVILDCGTGLRMLGRHLEANLETEKIEPHIFVTHYHWDHIQGIPFFSPLYSEENHFHFYSFRSEYLGSDSLKRVFEAQMAYPYFPVDLSAMSAKREFTEVNGGDQFSVPGARVTARWLHHPQGCLGFRFETSAGIVAYATDNEPGDPKLDKSLLELADGADIFINDAQFTPEQLATTRKGWGHSSWLEGVKIAKEAGVKNLVLFHHDPDSNDKLVDFTLREARGAFENVWAAAEGMVMSLGDDTLDVVIPAVREGLRRDANFRARVTGLTDGGMAFEEETVISDLSLHGALIYLDHSPKLQSELQVMLDNPGIGGASDSPLRLRGYVVRIEAGADKDRTAVGIVFTE